MSKTIQEGFVMTLEVASVGSIKPVASGTFKNDQGELIKYGSSLQFRATNIEEIEDEELGLKEVETHLEIKIPCKEDKNVKELNMFLRDLKNKGQIFKIKTTLPRQSDTNIYKVVSVHDAIDFMAMNGSKNSTPPKPKQ